jgi:hypothetical protein
LPRKIESPSTLRELPSCVPSLTEIVDPKIELPKIESVEPK